MVESGASRYSFVYMKYTYELDAFYVYHVCSILKDAHVRNERNAII